MKKLQTRFDLVNEDTETIFSQSPWEDATYCDTLGELYRESQDQWGRCTSKIYIDKPEGGIEHVGWYFVSRDKYEDRPYRGQETYLRGAWVHFRWVEAPDPDADGIV